MEGETVRRHAPVSCGLAGIVLPALALAGSATRLPAQSTPHSSARSTLADVANASYVRQSWTVENGLPVNAILALAQDHDGYLWLGTFDGLVRFDGVRFTVFNAGNTPALPSNRIIALRTSPDSSLWIWTETSQLVRLRRGEFTHFDSTRGMTGPLTAWRVDDRGRMWVGTSHGLGVVHEGTIRSIVRSEQADSVLAIASQPDGRILAGTDGGRLFQVDGQRATPMAWPGESPLGSVHGLHVDPGGTVWVIEGNRLWRYGEPAMRGRVGTARLLINEPSTGDLWIVAGEKVSRLRNDTLALAHLRPMSPHTRDGVVLDDAGAVVFGLGDDLVRSGTRFASLLPSGVVPTVEHTITAVLRDREGSFWVGTSSYGLHRIKSAVVNTYSRPEGLVDGRVATVYEDANGSIWAGSTLPHRFVGDRMVPVSDPLMRGPETTSFLSTRAGEFFIGAAIGHGLFRCLPEGRDCRHVPELHRPRILAMHEDRHGTVWVGTDPRLYRRDRGVWEVVPDTAVPLSAPVRAFAEEQDGTLWMATNGGGLIRYRDGAFRRISTNDGLPLEQLRGMYIDRDGWLWAGTEGRGLLRLDPREWRAANQRGRIVTYRSSDGLFDETIHGILEDDSERFWMSTNRGLFWVRRRALMDFADGRMSRLHVTSYTEQDGLRNREANGGTQPALIRARDGRLWFATQDGAAVVDPARIRMNEWPPNVVIEQVVSNGRTYAAAAGELALARDQRDLELQYTALSFLAPANVQFRYRLDPYDTAWVDAGNRRAAFYTKVPPGSYTFRVVASNNDGVWNEAGASLRLTLRPAMWETTPFRILLAIVLSLSIAWAVRLRVRRLNERAHELALLVDERTNELRMQREVLARQAEQLQQLDAVKSRFFANISHEFRTPLTLTVGPLENLRTLVSTTHAGAARQAATALRNARRLLRLVDELMDVARLEAGEMKLQAEVKDIVRFSRGMAGAFLSINHNSHRPCNRTATWVLRLP
jgi:ligand-binding sensor domain-containing protein